MRNHRTDAARRLAGSVQGAIERLHRSLFEFIAFPALIVIGFVGLAEIVDWLDNHAGPRRSWSPLRSWLAQYVGDTQAAIGVLSAIVGSLFTVTSITFSILLLAVQQGATVLNSQIVDHFLRRGSNRAWFGFFVGVSLFALITLVQTTHTSTPVLGVMVSTLLSAIALFALVVLIYGTIDQMRPATLVDTIVATAIAARRRQMPLLLASRPAGRADAANGTVVVPATRSGHLVRIDTAALTRILSDRPDLYVTIQPAIGDFVTAGDALARLSGEDDDIADRVSAALHLGDQRDVADDAGYSLHHLHTIGWTAISTARSDPAVGTIAIHALRDLSVAWQSPPARADNTARLIYDDRLSLLLIDTLESFMVASTESRQHQTFAQLLDTVSALLADLPPSMIDHGGALADTAAMLATEHIPTRVVLAALDRCAAACTRQALPGPAQRLGAIRRDLADGPRSTS